MAFVTKKFSDFRTMVRKKFDEKYAKKVYTADQKEAMKNMLIFCYEMMDHDQADFPTGDQVESTANCIAIAANL